MKKLQYLHPILFATMPVLVLFAENVEQLVITQIARSIFASLLVTILILIFLWRKSRDWEWAALLTSLFLILFFNYGYVFASFLVQLSRLAEKMNLHLDFNQLVTISHGILLLLWIGIAMAGILLVKRAVKWRPQLTQFFFLLGIGSIILPAITLSKNWKVLMPPSTETMTEFLVESTSVDRTSKPDIYYIILDGYGREDTIEEFFEYDNSPFITRLNELGFFVAAESRSNYSITYQSLASSMNMEYLDRLMEFPSTNPLCTHSTGQLLNSGVIMENLRDEGYEIRAIASDFEFTEIRSADNYIYQKGMQMNVFEAMLLHNSLMAALYDFSVLIDGPFEYPGHQVHRDHVNFIFDELAKMPKKQGPKFVFAHIISPHPPFVFGPNGEAKKQRLPYGIWDGDTYPGTKEEYYEGYRDQLTFINQKVEQLVQILLQESKTEPIIILQGDHGSKSSMEIKVKSPEILRESVAILNGYYFPRQDYSSLYASISPVNSFRVILNQYFDKNLPLLQDLTYFSFEACNGVSDLIP